MTQTTASLLGSSLPSRYRLLLGFGAFLAVAAAVLGTTVANSRFSDADRRSTVQTDIQSNDLQAADNADLPTSKEIMTPDSSDTGTPGASNTSHSSTSITVNGRTDLVTGDTSLQKSYTTQEDDGSTTHVDISVQNQSSTIHGIDGHTRELQTDSRSLRHVKPDVKEDGMD